MKREMMGGKKGGMISKDSEHRCPMMEQMVEYLSAEHGDKSEDKFDDKFNASSKNPQKQVH